MKTKNLRKNVMLLAPLFGLVALLVAFFIIGTSKNINVAYGMKSIINQSVVVAVVATGAIFIYTLGSFDISLGASVAVSALVGGIVYNKTESLVIMFAACLGVAVFIGLFNSVLASIFNLPVFVTTIAMLSVLNALVLVLIKMNGTGSEIRVPMMAVSKLNTTQFKIFVLAAFFLVCLLVFSFTKVGRMQKFQGGNPICAKLSGISVKKMSIIAFIMSGIGVGLGACLSIVYAPTLTRNTAWKRLADKLGIYFDETINNRLRGVSRMESLEIILEKSTKKYSKEEKEDFAEQKNKMYVELLEDMTPADLPKEVKTTLDDLRKQGVLLAIGSSSKNAKRILKHLGLENYFDAISDGTNITKSKPDPEVFLKAAEYLQLEPQECLVVEDAVAGIKAATAGGFDSAGLGEASECEMTTYPLSGFAELRNIN